MSESTSSAHVADTTTKRRKRLIAGIVVLVLAAAAVVAYIAYGPKPTAGTLGDTQQGSVTVKWGTYEVRMKTNGADGFMPSFDNVVPGKSDVETVTFINDGTVKASFKFRGGVPVVKDNPNVSETYLGITSDGRRVLAPTAFPDLPALNNTYLFDLAPGEERSYDLTVSMPQGASSGMRGGGVLSMPVDIVSTQKA